VSLIVALPVNRKQEGFTAETTKKNTQSDAKRKTLRPFAKSLRHSAFKKNLK